MHKTTGDGWNQYSLFIIVLSMLLYMQKNDRSCLVPIETSYSGPNVAVLHANTTDEGWDP